MLVFICDRWYKVREVPDDKLLYFVSTIAPDREGYFYGWESETSKNAAHATKVLPFCGHENGVYEGCTMVCYHPDGPPHSWLIEYKNKVIYKIDA